jgi:hypothetical protein
MDMALVAIFGWDQYAAASLEVASSLEKAWKVPTRRNRPTVASFDQMRAVVGSCAVREILESNVLGSVAFELSMWYPAVLIALHSNVD